VFFVANLLNIEKRRLQIIAGAAFHFSGKRNGPLTQSQNDVIMISK